jgi:hypothetical protein
MSPPSSPVRLSLGRVVLVGLILPVFLTFVDCWLLAREYQSHGDVAAAQAMAAYVLQVGLLGVLCGRLIEIPWLRWVIFGWCLLVTDLNAWSSLFPYIAEGLFTAQIGLVTIWVVLGTARWTIRLPVALLLIVPVLATIAQSAALCLLCLVLRSQRFHLAFVAPDYDLQVALRGDKPRASRPIQFGVGDVLLWTTALAPLLAVARFLPGRTLTEGVLHAIVLVAALWAALGEGPAWLRWPLLGFVALLAGVILASVDWYQFAWIPRPAFWSWQHWNYLWRWQWDTVLSFFLPGGMLAATILIYRVLGFRLCRLSPAPSRATAALAALGPAT